MVRLPAVAAVAATLAPIAGLAAEECGLKISKPDDPDHWLESRADTHPGFEVCGDCQELFLLRLDEDGGQELRAFKSVKREIGEEVWGGKREFPGDDCEPKKIDPDFLNSYCIEDGFYTGSHSDRFERLPFWGSDSTETKWVIRREPGYKESWDCPKSPMHNAVEVSGPKPDPSCKGVLLASDKAANLRRQALVRSECLRDLLDSCTEFSDSDGSIDLSGCLRVRLAPSLTSPKGIQVTDEEPHGLLSLLTIEFGSATAPTGVLVADGPVEGDRYLWRRSRWRRESESEMMFPLKEKPGKIYDAEGDLVLDEQGQLVGMVADKRVRSLPSRGLSGMTRPGKERP